jgi:multiple sugar transport system permease protein
LPQQLHTFKVVTYIVRVRFAFHLYRHSPFGIHQENIDFRKNVIVFISLIIPQFGGQAFFIFLMVQFIRGITRELDESVMIDGCNKFSIFGRIIFPLVKPALITSTIFSFYWRWDDFLGPLLYLNRPRSFTVSLALRMFSDPATSTDWGAIFAMGTLSLIPVFFIFVIFQKYIVEGMVTSGLKV